MSAPAATGRRRSLLPPARLAQLAARHRDNATTAWGEARLLPLGSAAGERWALVATRHRAFAELLERAATTRTETP